MTREEIPFAIAWPDGSLAILHYTVVGRGDVLPPGAVWLDEKAGWWRREPTTENVESRVLPVIYERNVSESKPVEGVSWHRLGSAPPERDFRAALVYRNGACVVDLPRACQVVLQRVREHRAPQLDKLDKDWMRATGRGEDTAAIELQRQALRDLPQTLLPQLQACATVEDLRAFLPME